MIRTTKCVTCRGNGFHDGILVFGYWSRAVVSVGCGVPAVCVSVVFTG